MAATTVAGKLRRGRKRAGKLAVAGAAVASGAALMAGPAPVANALDVEQRVLLAGPLVNLVPAFGIDSIGPLNLGTVPVVGDLNLTLNLTPIAYDTQNIYNTVNALPFQRRKGAFGSNAPFNDRVYSNAGPDAGQFPAILSSGPGSLNAIKAWRTQIDAVQNAAPAGYTPFEPGTANLPNVTNQELLLLRNPLRPNGGIMTRFGPLLNIFGVDTTMPDPGLYQNADGSILLNTGTADLTWAYDPLGDFPVTLNPFSIVNSLLALIPLNLTGGVSLEGLTDAQGQPVDLATGLGLSVAGTLGILNRVVNGAGVTAGEAFYGTLVPNDLPILEPLRLPVKLINLISSALGAPLNLPTPIADALEPAFKILVNTGYSDVITPDELNSCAVNCGTDTAQSFAQLGYSAYDRSYLTASTTQPFLSVNPLTPQQWLRVPGDVITALVGGVINIPPATASTPAPAAASTAASTAVAAVSPAAARSAARAAASTSSESPAQVSVTAPAAGAGQGADDAPSLTRETAGRTPARQAAARAAAGPSREAGAPKRVAARSAAAAGAR